MVSAAQRHKPVSRSTTAASDAAHARPFRIGLPWPQGTTIFAFKTWLALAIGFYAAFALQIEGALSTGICILIVAQPTQGMVLSKAVYRTAGTLVGVVAAIVISAVFPQDRTMLIASFAVWLGFLTTIATLLRDFRAYGCVLAGYTVAIVSIVNIDAPNATFDSAINRVAAILIGVAAITLANILLSDEAASQSLTTKLRMATVDVVKMARSTLNTRLRPPPESCIDMAARLMPLRSEISYASPEKPNGRARAAGGRSALLGLFEAISACEAVGAGLSQMIRLSPLLVEAIGLTQKAIGLQTPERCLQQFDAMSLDALKAGNLPIEDAQVLDRLRFLITTLGDVRDGARAVRSGLWPRRVAALPVHQDYVAAVLNATRVMVSIAVVAILSVWSGIPDTARALLFTGVFVALGSIQPNPAALGNAALFGLPIVVVLSAVYSFFIFPTINGYPLFILSLAPLAILMCWLIMINQPGYGLIIGAQTLVQVAPANVQTIDPALFVSSATMLIPSGLAIFLAFRLVLPAQPALRRLRLALGVGTSLRNALADKGRLTQPLASLHYDRLAQFKTWQGRETVTLARHKTMLRLVDLGLLAYAVRRSWRALDSTKSFAPADLDARARHILPTLSPDETEAVARDYLAQAVERAGPIAPDDDDRELHQSKITHAIDSGKSERDASAIALLHAAAALYGTAMATDQEQRLLRHAELLRRIA
jgi:uncharacterized membrane protein YccC